MYTSYQCTSPPLLLKLCCCACVAARLRVPAGGFLFRGRKRAPGVLGGSTPVLAGSTPPAVVGRQVAAGPASGAAQPSQKGQLQASLAEAKGQGSEVNAGYVYVWGPHKSQNVTEINKPVPRTFCLCGIVVWHRCVAYVRVDHAGRLRGIYACLWKPHC